MPGALKRSALERQEYLLLRDFCDTASQLEKQFGRFRQSGDVSCPILEDLLGRQRNRGPLWQMKDTAHLLARQYERQSAAGQNMALLDIAIGAIFHMTKQVKELAHLNRAYAPRALAAAREAGAGSSCARLANFLKQATAALGPAMQTLEELVKEARALMCAAYSGRSGNVMVAAFMRDEPQFVADAFGPLAPQFLALLALPADPSPTPNP